MAVSLGCHVQGVAPQIVDALDPESRYVGATKRQLRTPPNLVDGELDPLTPALMRDFRQFVRLWIRRNFEPIQFDADTSLEAWLSRTNYPEARKQQLRDANARCSLQDLVNEWGVRKKETRPVSHTKREFIVEPDEFKYPRVINARPDAFKAAVGPFTKLMEDVVYKNHFFIKHVPVADRPSHQADLFVPGDFVLATDHSNFEAHITARVQRACECQLYAYLLSQLPEGPGVASLLRNVCAAPQSTRGSGLVITEGLGCRMSGDMTTSLGNGFTNLMVMLFCMSRKIRQTEHRFLVDSDVRGYVEGDDGYFLVRLVPDVADFTRLGFRMKINVSSDVEGSDFCGMIFDSEELECMTDPFPVILKIGWTHAAEMLGKPRVRLGLLRAKALSLAYEFPGCPVLTSMSRWLLRATSNSAPIFDAGDEYWNAQVFAGRDREKVPPTRNIGHRSRLLFERRFGVSVHDQFVLEAYFDRKKGLSCIDHPIVTSRLRTCPALVRMWDDYVKFFPPNTPYVW